jgi:hypothetical protein
MNARPWNRAKRRFEDLLPIFPPQEGASRDAGAKISQIDTHAIQGVSSRAAIAESEDLKI